MRDAAAAAEVVPDAAAASAALARLQAAFAARIDALAGAPEGAAAASPGSLAPWLDARHAAALRRYGAALRAHRLGSLTQVYPVLLALGGAPWFAALARAYGAALPADSPDLARFGRRLPRFLAGWPGAHGYPYFADVARLEWLLHAAERAADSVPLDARAVRAAGNAALAWRLRLAPGAALFRSDYRAVAIWRAHAAPGANALPPAARGATRALVYRQGWRARVREVGAAEARALDAFARGACLSEALAAARATDPCAAGALFTGWLEAGILVRAGD